ncbi:MAG: hypothetical protein KGD74_02680 [Candidatus Lokiarchaeota archaeon]|nr:hypothetical protein [Candidatus Lokiarchaeota archaeon]
MNTCNEISYLSNFNFIKTREPKTKNLKGCDVTFEENRDISKSHFLSMKLRGEFQVSFTTD